MLTFSAIAAIVVAIGISIHFWRRSENIAAILMDGAKSYEELRQKNMRLESAVLGFESQVSELKRKDDQNRRTMSQTSATNIKTEQLHLDTVRDFERRIHNTEQQRDHMIQVHDALKAKYDDVVLKVEELTSAAAAWAAERAELKKQLKDLGAHNIEKLKAELIQLRNQNQDLDRDLKHFKSKEKEVISPRDFDTLKRRASHYERLYTGMKGLRDMVDERNKNWEDALGKMARWILTSSPVAKPNDPVLAEGIGPIVGEALERVGLSILEVDDQQDHHAAHHSSSSASSDLDFRAGAQSESIDPLPV